MACGWSLENVELSEVAPSIYLRLSTAAARGQQQFVVLNSCIMDRNILGFVTILCFVEFNYGPLF
jgi:hypothetical protein